MTQREHKYKVGDKIRVKTLEGGSIRVNPKLYMDYLVGTVQTVSDVDSDGDIWVRNTNEVASAEGYREWCLDPAWIEPIEKTLYNLEPGDVLVDEDGDERTVIDVLPNSVLLSSYSNKNNAGTWMTPNDLERRGYKLKDAPTTGTTELSVAELEEKLGIEAGTLRVKKD